MNPLENHSIELLIEQLVSYTQKETRDSKDLELFTQFLRLYYSQAYTDDFEEHSLEILYLIAVSHWRLLRQRQPNQLKLRVFNPTVDRDGWESSHTIIEVVSRDMPFLVDSMRMELNQLGLRVYSMLYMGGMKIERDEFFCVKNIFPYNSNQRNLKIESPIRIEISRVVSKKHLEKVQKRIEYVLSDVRSAFDDWPKIQHRLRDTIRVLSHSEIQKKSEELNETIAFLKWMLEDNFTFLGAEDYERTGIGLEGGMRLLPSTRLGILKNKKSPKTLRKYVELPKPAREIELSKDQVLILSKTNTLSTVHRLAYTDCVSVKIFDENQNIIKERSFFGLYTSTAYNASPREIPFIRKKVDFIFKRSGLPIRSHSGKDLMHILSTLPRDDLFQGSVNKLYSISMNILHLKERRRVRLFLREDSYNRYVSALVFLPKENFNTDVLNLMMQLLRQVFNGTAVHFDTDFSSSILARIHFVIYVNSDKHLSYDIRNIEVQLAKIAKSWNDGFREELFKHFDEETGSQVFEKYIDAFPAGYRETFLPENSVKDIEHIELLSDISPLGMSFYRPQGAPRDVIRFKLYREEQTVPLSDALPILENMGLRVIGEQPYCITFFDCRRVWINDFNMTYLKEPTFEVEEVKVIFQEAFYKIWSSDAENDAFNRLVLEAQLTWKEIALLRAYAKYLKQIGYIYSPEYIAETLVNHAGIAHLLKDLFQQRFDPNLIRKAGCEVDKIKKLIEKMLDDVVFLDEDRIMRLYMELILATLRTNYYQFDSLGKDKSYLSLKFDSSKIPDIPLPIPKYEVFVYSRRFEGVHLRSDKVARGGLRWSDRREDFRTEVLGLMKAQRVKNALIVPAGAKGGFVPKSLPIDASREEIIEEGVACYRGFIQGLLDITDNMKQDQILSPEQVVCYDDYDPYLVVAADKGTATFSDIANSISLERSFWLGDAFASGGSSGYDHKKMGITARGAWVSAERHFQELGVNLDNSEITVIGIGDMSGDVFGNGMLLSPYLKLVAAFNHLHIFIDPNPDPKVSFAERLRLFEMQRSSWNDYDSNLLSTGGGVFSRSAKLISLTPQIKTLLHLSKDEMVPNELISAILKAPVDMLWNGGIGTYVKASSESHDDVVDRSNDGLRVNAADMRAKVVCEGGNLGFTQLGRIEYALKGGRINTDFIDNSAGVDCSDHEVNIKILLNDLAFFDETQRNALLTEMTDEVAELVLQNNYHQNRAISLESFLSSERLSMHVRYLERQVQDGKINRELEFLPDKKTLMERKAAKIGLTRPEISILFAYSKIILEAKIRESNLPEDSYFSQYVKNVFPTPLRNRYETLIKNHRLHREIISTQISNQMVSNMGLTFAFQLQDEMNANVLDVVRAYKIAYKVFHMEELYTNIESLNYKVDPTNQLKLSNEVVQLVRRATRWFLRSKEFDIQKTIDNYSEEVSELFRKLPDLILGNDKARLEGRRDELIKANVPSEIAVRMASLSPMYHALNIIDAANTESLDIYEVAKVYFILVDRLDLLLLRNQINLFPTESRWTVLAKAAYKGDLDVIQRKLTISAIHFNPKETDLYQRVDTWMKKHTCLISRCQSILNELSASSPKDFEIFSAVIRTLSELSKEDTALVDTMS